MLGWLDRGGAGNSPAIPLLTTASARFWHRGSSDFTRVILDSMTIVLPVACFASLHALSMVGGLTGLSSARSLYPGWEPLHDRSLDGISIFNVLRSVARSTITLPANT